MYLYEIVSRFVWGEERSDEVNAVIMLKSYKRSSTGVKGGAIFLGDRKRRCNGQGVLERVSFHICELLIKFFLIMLLSSQVL